MAIKTNIAEALKQGSSSSEKDDDGAVTADQMRLLLPAPKSTVLEDDKEIRDYEDISNDAILNVVFQISENQWEHVAVDSTDVTTASASSPAS